MYHEQAERSDSPCNTFTRYSASWFPLLKFSVTTPNLRLFRNNLKYVQYTFICSTWGLPVCYYLALTYTAIYRQKGKQINKGNTKVLIQGGN